MRIGDVFPRVVEATIDQQTQEDCVSLLVHEDEGRNLLQLS